MLTFYTCMYGMHQLIRRLKSLKLNALFNKLDQHWRIFYLVLLQVYGHKLCLGP